ncbi:MAG: zinc ABC transporter substrate-binding protein [Gammaproteobacteria bacterium]|nr:MAG: zinc ABC transporter substrate-binding protein [Gammaproteobacteria bacterium]
MKNMIIKESSSQVVFKLMSAIVLLGVVLILTACSNKPAEDSHLKHAEKEHEQQHSHKEHADHDQHDDMHALEATQVMPKGYTVNFAVSNHPLFLLSEAVTKGTNTTVKKLLNTGDIGHHGSLSPSDIKMVNDSKYVVWFGKNLESNLSATLVNGSNTVTILNEATINMLQRRDEKMQLIANSTDPHIWLDPQNAKIIVNKLAKLHSEVNPKYEEQYQANAKKFAKDLDELVAKQKAKVGGHNKYWSSHDAFQYFEKSLGIELVGTLTTDHEVPVKASQILWLKNNRPYKVMCLITQNKAKVGVINKLAPITNTVLREDMSGNTSFIDAWKNESQKMIDCVNNSQ